MFQVYAIQSEKDMRIYVGSTADFNKRLKEHNSGRRKSTKGYMPWKLLYLVNVDDRSKALLLEKKWKSGFCREWLKTCVPVAQLDTCLPAGREQQLYVSSLCNTI